MADTPKALNAHDVPQTTGSNYPDPFQQSIVGREKRRLGDYFGLRNFGVNQTHLAPRAMSALRHAHATQDEFIYVLVGHPTLVTNAGTTQLAPGMYAGFPAHTGDAHHLINRLYRK